MKAEGTPHPIFGAADSATDPGEADEVKLNADADKAMLEEAAERPFAADVQSESSAPAPESDSPE